MRVWVLALLVLPLAGASEASVQLGIWNPDEAADVRLYFHPNGLQDFPINTQGPPADFVWAEPLGLATHSQGCVDNPISGVGASTHHTYYGYVSPGNIVYEPGERPRYHAERGIGSDLRLDPTGTPMLDWYMESQPIGQDQQPAASTAPMVIPDVVVQATMREGDQISVDHAEMNTGRIVAQGRVGPATLSPLWELPEGVSHHAVEGRHVYGFHIPMPIQTDGIIPKAESFNIRIDVFVENPVCADPAGDGYAMPDWLRIHTSDGLRPGMDLRVFEAIRIESITAQVDEGVIVARLDHASPFGGYDAVGAARVVGGDVGILLPPEPCYEHACGTWKSQFSWTLNATGRGVVTFEATNLQGTAVARGALPFDMGDPTIHGCAAQEAGAICSASRPPPEETTPGVPVAFLLAALALLARRR